ncbi:helicase-associated domain-containing protein [Deinococcus fonticola]|uniref:helicase-associated domain-containing protein n=1 Tax=Deinococcus fonticola TaxID=2528713 RepID=UPI00107529BA|nr:helicase-associated domain-containing protein [Deinococcus fonticola]
MKKPQPLKKTLSRPAPDFSEFHPLVADFRLDKYTDMLGNHHALKVARRISGASKVTGLNDASRLIRETLNTPAEVDKLIARLHPTELLLLQELRRRGGLVSSWELFTFARLRDLPLPKQNLSLTAGYLFKDYQPAQWEAASLVWSLLADGLLFPSNVPNPWLSGDYSYYRRTEWRLDSAPPQTVLADPRLLSRLPDDARPAAPLPPPTEAKATTSSLPVTLARLQLLEIVRAVQSIGGVGLTKAGQPAKNDLKRLLRELGGLTEPETWLGLAMLLGLLVPDSNGERLVPLKVGVEMLRSFPAYAVQSGLDSALPALDTPEDAKFGAINPYTVRACLLALLNEWDRPVRESDLKTWLEKILPSQVLAFGAQMAWGRVTELSDKRGAAWNDWLDGVLRGLFTLLGKVTVEGEGKDTVIIAHRLTPDDTPPSGGPAWVLQPNFELLVYPAQLTEQQLPMLAAAEAVRFDAQTAVYRLTRSSVYAALEQGLALPDLLAGLEEGSATPLSPAMRRSIEDWAARRDRLVLHQGATLLEYPSRGKRDAALQKGGQAVGETYLLLDAGKKPPVGVSVLNYADAPKETLKFSASGEFILTAPLDLLGRALLSGRVKQVGKEKYRFVPPAEGQTYPGGLLGDVEARTVGKLPEEVRLQLGIWTGRTPAPALSAVTLFQHPQASALARLPRLAGLLGTALSAELYTVTAAKEAQLQAALSELGLPTTSQFRTPKDADADLVVISDTRKKREYLEGIIAAGQNVRLRYHEEKRGNDWYGTVSKGRLRVANFKPLKIDRTGSTPYLEAKFLEGGEEERIRIGYIVALGAL